MKRYISLIALFFSSSAFSGVELSIGGLSGWDSKDVVVGAVGEPERKEVEFGMYDDSYHYPGFVLYFMGDYLVNITSHNEEVCTAQNICPGDDVDKAVSAYGSPEVKSHESYSSDQYNFYEVMADRCWYLAEVEGLVIKEVSVACH